MKTIFTCFVCLLLTSIVFGQTTFRTAISGFNEYQLYDLVQMNDGSYISVGYNYLQSKNSEGMSLVKLNSSGQLISSKTLVPNGLTDDMEGIDIIKTSDGGVVVSGYVSDSLILMKLNTDLTIQWSKRYTTTAGDYTAGTRVLQTPDGGYMIVGYIGKETENNYSEAGLLIKTTSDGTVSWSKQYFDYSELDETYKDIYDIVATKDGNYAFLSSNYGDYLDEEKDSTYLVKINGSGNVIWARAVTTPLDDQYPISLLSASDGSLLVAGSIDRPIDTLGFTFDASQMMLLKFDQSGNLLWSRTTVNSLTSIAEAFGITEDSDGGYLLTGGVDSVDLEDNTIASGYIVKISTAGSLVWTKYVSTPEFTGEFFFSAIRTSDGGYASCGYSGFSNGGTDNLNRGIIYKFNSGFGICGSTASLGTIENLNATALAKSVTVKDITSTASSIGFTASSVGTVINICDVLPVQLLSFTATLQNRSVSLQWKTANEINTDYFTVERSSNTSSFAALQTLPAKGNSNTVQTYTTTDLQPLFGTSYYRLKQADKDGQITYSSIVPVTVTANGTVVVSPNPVLNNVRVLIQSIASSQVTFRTTDMAGKVLATQNTTVSEGANTVIIPAASLTHGMYILKVIENNHVQSIKFVKQ